MKQNQTFDPKIQQAKYDKKLQELSDQLHKEQENANYAKEMLETNKQIREYKAGLTDVKKAEVSYHLILLEAR